MKSYAITGLTNGGQFLFHVLTRPIFLVFLWCHVKNDISVLPVLQPLNILQERIQNAVGRVHHDTLQNVWQEKVWL
jgi:hypothetical protein